VTIKRGDIYYADLSPVVGSEQGGVRPVLIVQNDVGNKFSPTVIAAAITSQKYKTNLPTHIQVHANDCGLAKDSIVLLEQVRTLDKRRLRERMGNLAPDDMNRINRQLWPWPAGERRQSREYINSRLSTCRAREALEAGIFYTGGERFV